MSDVMAIAAVRQRASTLLRRRRCHSAHGLRFSFRLGIYVIMNKRKFKGEGGTKPASAPEGFGYRRG
jgi:hypothetical protein